jgi:hypothetical protein
MRIPFRSLPEWSFVRIALLLLSLLVSCRLQPVKGCSDRLALRFLPPNLMDPQFAKDGPARIECAQARVDLAGGGTAEYTAFAFTNGETGAFVVIKGSGDSATKVFSLSRAGMLGDLSPELTISDLDGDHIPEMVVSYTGRAGVSSVWVFQARGQQIRSITPLDPEDEEVSLLENAFFADFDGDGRKDAISRARLAAPVAATASDDPRPLVAYRVYRMRDGAFDTQARPVLFATRMAVGKEESVAVEETFTFSGSDSTGHLRLVSAEISMLDARLALNGAALPPADGVKMRSRLDLPIHLQSGQNTVSGRIFGRAESEVALFVY